MSVIGNLLWFLLGGILLSLGWFITGLLWSITVIGLPVGVQCFKFARLALWPFGSEIDYSRAGAGSLLLNVLWLLLGGLELACGSAAVGLVFCVSIVGIPFGLQCFKLAQLALMPFGATVVSK